MPSQVGRLKATSRRAVKEFANAKELPVFVAASDASTSRLLDYKAAQRGHPAFAFDVPSAYARTDEGGLVFLEPPEEEIEEYGPSLARAVNVIYAGARERGVGRTASIACCIAKRPWAQV